MKDTTEATLQDRLRSVECYPQLDKLCREAADALEAKDAELRRYDAEVKRAHKAALEYADAADAATQKFAEQQRELERLRAVMRDVAERVYTIGEEDWHHKHGWETHQEGCEHCTLLHALEGDNS